MISRRAQPYLKTVVLQNKLGHLLLLSHQTDCLPQMQKPGTDLAV